MKPGNFFLNSTKITASLVLVFGSTMAFACGGNSPTILALPTLGGSIFSVAGLNASGQLTGQSGVIGDAESRAFLFGGGGVMDLTGLPSEGRAINDLGQVVGAVNYVDAYETHAFLYRDGQTLDLGTLGGWYATAIGVNNSGQVAGNSFLEGDSQQEAFIYDGSPIQSLGNLGGGYSYAVAINNRGEIVGDSANLAFETHAFLYQTGTMHDLGTLGGAYSSALALNDLGMVVGESTLLNESSRAFLYATDSMQDLGTLGGDFSSAHGINSSGQVIGASETISRQMHAFIYGSSLMTDLGTLGGGYSYPFALNDRGQVVGFSQTASGVEHAFLWENGTLTDLNSLLPANSGWELLGAQFINNAGQVAGYGLLNGQHSRFLLNTRSANQPPVAIPGADQTLECPAQVVLDGSQSTDPDGDLLSYEWALNGAVVGTQAALTTSLPLGDYVFILKVTDPCGEFSEAPVKVSVVDSRAPEVISISASPSMLPNPNQRLVAVTVSVLASDACDPAPASRIVSVAANETVEPGDVQITGDLTLKLAATRNPSGSGRIYTIIVGTTDSAGNAISTPVIVTVPKGSGKTTAEPLARRVAK